MVQARGALVLPNQGEFPVYVALKLYVYDRITVLFSSKPSEVRRHVNNILTGLTVRKVHRVVTSGTKNQSVNGRLFTDFFEVTPHYFKNRMESLNHGTILCAAGRGLRGAVAYRWNEPIDQYTLQSFRKMNDLLGGRLNLGLDVFRILEWFDGKRFTANDFQRFFSVYRDKTMERRWFKIISDTPSKSIQFQRFLRERLQQLVKLGILIVDGGKYQLTPVGRQVAFYFELFVFSVAYEDGSEES